MRGAFAINSTTLKIHKSDNLHTKAMMHAPAINTYVAVGKETGHRGGQRLYHDVCYVTAVVGEKARLDIQSENLFGPKQYCPIVI